MSSTIALEQIERVVWNQHQNPFEVLGPHPIEQDGKQVWVIRSYLPNADMAWVLLPGARTEYAMSNDQHPQFFEAIIDVEELVNYQIRYKEGACEHVVYDPYAFKSPVITDFDIHLFGEGNHQRIYEKNGRSPHGASWHCRCVLRRVGTQRPKYFGDGRLQQLGWAAAPNAQKTAAAFGICLFRSSK